jgi:hypothetical protein
LLFAQAWCVVANKFHKMNVVSLLMEQLLQENINDECFVLTKLCRSTLIMLTFLSSLVGSALVVSEKIHCNGEDDGATMATYCHNKCYTVIGVDSLYPGVGKTGTGAPVVEEQKIYQRYYLYYVYILCACISLLLFFRSVVRHWKGTELESFCVHYVAEKEAHHGTNQERTDALAQEMCDYLTINSKQHLKRLVKMTLCEVVFLALVTSEMFGLNMAFNGAFQNYLTFTTESPYGATFPDMGNY